MKIVVGIGSEVEQRLPARVLESSIRCHTTASVDFIDLCDLDLNSVAKGNTPFSLQRFLFAEWYLTMGFDYGVYLDSDMCVFGDITDLIHSFVTLDVPIGTCGVPAGHMRRPQSAVMVFDRQGAIKLAERFKRYKSAEIGYSELMYLDDERGFSALPSCWNCLEYFDSETQLIHWTDMDGQPWLRSDNHLGGLWVFALLQWLDQSKSNWNLFHSEINKGHIRPSLSEAIQAPFSSHITLASRFRDSFFLPPHRFQRVPKVGRTILRPFLKMLINGAFLIRGRQVNNHHG